MRNKLGGYEGRKLEAGDWIGFTTPKEQLPLMEKRRIAKEVFQKKEITLRVVTGSQDTEFTEEEIRRFFGIEQKLPTNLIVWDVD